MFVVHFDEKFVVTDKFGASSVDSEFEIPIIFKELFDLFELEDDLQSLDQHTLCVFFTGVLFDFICFVDDLVDTSLKLFRAIFFVVIVEAVNEFDNSLHDVDKVSVADVLDGVLDVVFVHDVVDWLIVKVIVSQMTVVVNIYFLRLANLANLDDADRVTVLRVAFDNTHTIFTVKAIGSTILSVDGDFEISSLLDALLEEFDEFAGFHSLFHFGDLVCCCLVDYGDYCITTRSI